MPTEINVELLPSDVVDVWWTYGKPAIKPPKKRRRSPSLSIVKRMAEKAGLSVAAYTVTRDGVTIVPGKPNVTPALHFEAGSNGAPAHHLESDIEFNPCDAVLDEADSYGRN